MQGLRIPKENRRKAGFVVVDNDGQKQAESVVAEKVGENRNKELWSVASQPQDTVSLSLSTYLAIGLYFETLTMESSDQNTLVEKLTSVGFVKVLYDSPGYGKCFYAAAAYQLQMKVSTLMAHFLDASTLIPRLLSI